MVKLTFPNADVRDVLTQYELLVGKRVLYDNTVQGQVNINVPEVPKEEAIRIIEITLLMNGYHLVPSDIDPNLIKATGIGRAPRSVGVPIFAEPEPIPDNEQVIMYMVKLRFADPAELAQVLQQAMPASRQEYSPNIVALPKAQALLVTENTAVLRGLLRIIRSADLEPTRVEGEFITLQRASAKDVVQMLEKLFEKPQTGATPAAPRPVVAPPKPADGANPAPAAAASPLTTVEIGGMNEDSMVAGKVRLTADERTNRIYVVSRPSNIPVLRKLIQQFDEDVPFNEPLVRLLKFVSAGDILEALVKAVSDPGTKDTGVPGAGGNTQGRPATQPQNNTLGAGSQFGNRGGLGGAGGLGGGGSGETLSLQGEQKEIVPTTVLVGNARIMADKRRNAIMVIGSQDMKEKVSNILDQLDVRSPQVMLTTVIGELTLTEGQDFGVNYLLHNGRRDLLAAGSATTAVNASGNSMALNLAQLLADPRSTRMLTGGAGGLTGFISAGDSLAALVTALESSGRFKVTHRPTLFASNNKTATIISGERVAVVTGSQATPLGGTVGNAVTNQVQYINVNLKLQVIPLINSEKEVNLDILQTLAEITRYDEIADSSGKNKYPVISDRQLSTTVLVPNEGTLVLGGLVKDRQERTRSGIPVLGKLPLLGGLFRSTGTKKDRTELVVLIRPSVSIGPEDVYNIRDRNMRPMRMPVNLEDELILPDPALSKSGRRSGDSHAASPVQLKPFRANAESIQTADGSGMRTNATPPPSPVETPNNPVPRGSDAATEKPAARKKSSKPQNKSAGE
jgi:type II secretion system protein D